VRAWPKLAGRIRPPSPVLERWVSVIKQGVEVLAILVAGWWAYTRFIQTEVPAQRRNFVTEQKIEWAASPHPSACYAILSVSFQNISKAEVRIEKVIQRAWLLPLPSLDDPIAYVDPEQLDNAPATDSISYADGPFVQDYPPQARAFYDLVWTIRRTPGIALFRVDLFVDSADREPTDWIYEWDEICGDDNSSATDAAPIRPRAVTRLGQ
jgi:hypothetical protein